MGMIVYMRILFSFIILLIAILDYVFCGNAGSSYNKTCQNGARVANLIFIVLILLLEASGILFPIYSQRKKGISKSM